MAIVPKDPAVLNILVTEYGKKLPEMFKRITIRHDKKLRILLESIHSDSSKVPVNIWVKCLASIHCQKKIVVKIYNKFNILAKIVIGDEGSYNSIIELFVKFRPKNKADNIEKEHDMINDINVE